MVSVKPDASSELIQKRQSEDYIRLMFSLDTYVELNIGDYIYHSETRQLYYLNKKPKISEVAKLFKYECIFEGLIHELKKTKVFLQTLKTGGGYYQDYKFPLTGTSETFLDFIVQNLNRNSTGWSSGGFKITETKIIQFNNWNVFEAIAEISKELGFDWYLNGKTIHFTGPVYTSPRVFQVGRKVGLMELTRMRVENQNIETIVYGYGSSDNLPPRMNEEGVYYDSEVLTENKLCFSGVDGMSKLEKNVNLFGRIESVQEFEIKPERIGIITDVFEDDFLSFKDTEIDFNINTQLISNTPAKINFLSGLLMGYEFKLSEYNDADKKITLISYEDQAGIVPNENLKPAVGDQYVLLDIIMPESYISAAETRLQESTQAYLDEKSKNLEYYEAQVDEEFMELFGISLVLGELIRIVSTSFQIDNVYEIKELTRNLIDTNKYTIRFGDAVPKSLLSEIKLLAFNTNQQLYNIQRTTYNSTEITNIIGAEALTWLTL